MALENIPWAVLGGRHSASVARMLAFNATAGAEGVSGISDLRVTQQTVATGTVKVAAGGATIINRYPGVMNESYVARAGSSTTVAVAANSSGATRYDLLVLRIDDWNFPGAQATPGTLPTDTVPVAKFQVISNVAASVVSAAQLGLNYPALALARIAIPNGVSAITDAMITDLRKKTVPQADRLLLAKGTAASRSWFLDVTTDAGKVFPDDALWTNILVPTWATKANIVGTWGSLVFAEGGSNGYLWVVVGEGRGDAVPTQRTGFDSAAGANKYRATFTTSDQIVIPPAMRGQNVTIALRGRSVTGLTSNWAEADAFSSISVDIQWLEDASAVGG